MPNPIFGPLAMGASFTAEELSRVSSRGRTSKPAIGDADGVQPADRTTAAQFQDADMAQRP